MYTRVLRPYDLLFYYKSKMSRNPHKLYGISLDLNGALGFDVTFDPLPNSKFTAFLNKAPTRYT